MVEVLYMDGSSEKLTGANIKYGDRSSRLLHSHCGVWLL